MNAETKDRRGETFLVDGLGCPRCGGETVIGVLLVTAEGKHNHTKYLCTYYGRGMRAPCGWEGWFVPAVSAKGAKA